MLSRRLKLRIGSIAAATVAGLSLNAASANAGILVAASPSCDDQSLSTPFTPWLDIADYTPLSGADFETGADGWTLSGGAQIRPGNESFYVSGADDVSSLKIPAGASVTSPAICVGLEHPTLRFFAKRNSGGFLGLSTMRVDVLFQTALGTTASLPIGVVPGVSSWQPTLPMTVIANLLPLLPGEHTPVAFRFTSMLGGEWSIDDVYVDPYARR